MSAPLGIDDAVGRFRAFNRFFTRVIGVLHEGLLDSQFSLTEVRVLFELHAQSGCQTAQLRRELDLDAGYLSRILARFDADGLITRRAAPQDARRQILALTARGRDIFAVLDAKSAAQARQLLGNLPPDSCGEIVDAMDLIRARLHTTRAAAPVRLRGPKPGELGWIVTSNGAGYAAEHGWNQEYEALVAKIVGDFAVDHDAQREAVWIADLDGCPVGAIMCRKHDDSRAKLRVLRVEPEARGKGVGQALVNKCVSFARQAQYEYLSLWTVDALAPARRLYQRAGFVLESQEPTRAFGADLVGQTWRLRL